MIQGLMIGIALAIPTGLYLRERRDRRRQVEAYEQHIAEMQQISALSEARQKRINALEMHLAHLMPHVRIVIDGIPWSQR